MAFLTSMNITGSALTATRLRMDIISENLAHQNTTRTDPNSETATPYRRKMVVYQQKSDNSFEAVFRNKYGDAPPSRGVEVAEIIEDEREFKPVYNPGHPDANEDGYVMMPNVDPVKETIDMMAATRAYDTNITAFNAIKAMASKALELGR